MEVSSSTDILRGVGEGMQPSKQEEDMPNLNRFATIDPSQLASSEARKATFYRVAAVTAMVAFAVIFLGAVVIASTFASPAIALAVTAAAILIYYKGVHGVLYEKFKKNGEIASQKAAQNQAYSKIINAIDTSKPGDALHKFKGYRIEKQRIIAMAFHWKLRANTLLEQLKPLEKSHHDLSHLLKLDQDLPKEGHGNPAIAQRRNELLNRMMKSESSEEFQGSYRLPPKTNQLLKAKQSNVCNQINQIKEANLYSAIIHAAIFDYLIAHMEDEGVVEDLGSFNAKNLTGHGVEHFTPEQFKEYFYTFKSVGGLKREQITPQNSTGLSKKIAELSGMISAERSKQIAFAKKGSAKAA